MSFYTTLFQKVSRKKTKNVPFLDGQAGSIFNKKWTFSENQGEKTEKKSALYIEKKSEKPTFFSEKKKCLALFHRKFFKSG